MSANKVIKSVSFNVTKNEDVLCLKQVGNSNFSGYVKKLILEDIKKNQQMSVYRKKNGGIKIVVR